MNVYTQGSRATLFLFFCILVNVFFYGECDDDNEDPVKGPSMCEVCKYLVKELEEKLRKSNSKDVIHTGHGLEKKRKIKYSTSDLRWTEALLEPHVCDKMLEYNIHKEKKGSLRFAKGQSETMQTLYGLRNKGVKVDLGMPYEMWDKPSAEVIQLQRKCYKLVEEYEDDLDTWYEKKQDQDLLEYFCKNLVLRNKDTECLYEETSEEEDKKDSTVKSRKKGKTKGDEGLKEEL